MEQETVDVAVPRRTPRPPSLREQRAATVKRVLEQFQATGSLPGSLRQQIVDDEYALRWSEGRPLTREAVERHVDEWAAGLLQKYDAKMGVRRKDK